MRTASAFLAAVLGTAQAGALRAPPPSAFQRGVATLAGATAISGQSRRAAIGQASLAAAAALAVPGRGAFAAELPGGDDFGDLPPQSARVFRQYRGPLQFAGDFFLFEFREMVSDISKWSDIESLYQSSSANGQGQPSALSRLILIPMQQISLSFPPDVSDELAEAKADMEKSLQQVVKATRMTNAAVSEGASQGQVKDAEKAWEAGRSSLNRFYALVNTAVGAEAMQPIPADPSKSYVRTRQRYTQYKKGLAICQNRGGSNLAGVWGQLMVYGTATDPCGDMPTVEAYLFGK